MMNQIIGFYVDFYGIFDHTYSWSEFTIPTLKGKRIYNPDLYPTLFLICNQEVKETTDFQSDKLLINQLFFCFISDCPPAKAPRWAGKSFDPINIRIANPNELIKLIIKLFNFIT